MILVGGGNFLCDVSGYALAKVGVSDQLIRDGGCVGLRGIMVVCGK